jgi:hypothetical protein
MKYARRTDRNHAEILQVFRKLGFSVADTSRLGQGFPDCVIARSSKTALCEIKDGKKIKSARALTEAQKKFWEEWRGLYLIVERPEDVLEISSRWHILCK